MKKYNTKDYINTFIVITSFLVILTIILLCTKDSIYVSKLDYIDQHYMIPEYFRNLFYETKQILPNFALNLGMGQNIYNFSYYGLINPIIIISYLLPFIKMVDYLTIVSILTIIVDIILFYKWISSHFENKTIRFITTFLLLCASPIILHSHRHIMFVNYMPFLLMGLIGADQYFNKNKKILLMLSILLIILTSYFFSIPALITLIIYGIFVYIKKTKQITIKSFLKDGIIYCIYFIIPILISAVLLIPTLNAILSNRLETTVNISLLQIILPNLKLDTILYNSYSMGLTSIILFAIINNLLIKNKQYKFLSIVFLIITFFPIINYILNGTMYINSKVFIPFIPIGLLLIANFINDILTKKVNYKKLITIFLIISIIGCIEYNKKLFFIIDSLLLLITLYIYNKTNKKNILIIPIILIGLITTLSVSLSDELSQRDVTHEQYNEEIKELINKTNDNDLKRTVVKEIEQLHDSNNIRTINEYKTTMYSSLTNKYYNNFYWNEFNNNNPYRNSTIIGGTDNILYNIYTSTGNYIAKENTMIGYEQTNFLNQYKLYQNKSAFSVVYANNKLMSTKEYEQLSYPYTVEALMNYTIIDKEVKSNYKTNIKEIKFDKKKLNLPKQDNKYSFTLDYPTTMNIKLDKQYNNKILFIRFNMEYSQSCSQGDTYIKINGVKNTLTCESWKYHNNNYTFDYVLSSKEKIDNLKIELSKGKFIISDIKLYELDYNNIKYINNKHDNLTIKELNKKEQLIKGTINVKEKSYLNITIPYDKGFEIYVDNKKTNYELINKAFIGFEINPGYHEIVIKYQSPLLKESKIISVIGIVLFITVIVIDKRKVETK